MRATELQRAACLINYPGARNALPGNGRHHERLEQPVLALGLAAGGSIRDNGRQHRPFGKSGAPLVAKKRPQDICPID
jgi:hypothetical protein